jgi:hypothetical protein
MGREDDASPKATRCNNTSSASVSFGGLGVIAGTVAWKAACTVFGNQMVRQLKNSCHTISKNSVL